MKTWERRVAGRLLGTVLLGAVGAAGVVAATEAWQRAAAAAEFERRARAVLAPVTHQIDSSFELLQSLAALFTVDPHVSRATFRAFVEPSFTRHPGLRALEWAPAVLPGDVRAFEQEAAGRFPGFRIFGRGDAAAARDDRSLRFPVWYVEPFAENRPAFGFDLASEPGRRAALDAAGRTGAPTGTRVVELVQGLPGFLAVAPVYASSGPPSRTGTDGLRGFVVAVFDLDVLLAAARAEAAAAEMTLAAIEPAEARDPEAPGLGRDLLVPGGSLAVRLGVLPGASWLPSPGPRWLGAFVALLVAALGSAVVLRSARAEALAAELKTANTALLAEVEERARGERSLRMRTTLLGLALETGKLTAWHLDIRSGTLTQSSPAGPLTTVVPPGPLRFAWLFRLIEPEDRARIEAYTREVVRSGGSHYSYEFWVPQPDGTRQLHAVAGRIERDGEGRASAFYGLEVDLTERRRLEEQVQNAQRVESLGMLAGGVAHDFNNLLMGITGGVAMLEGLVAHDEGAASALALIDRGATRAAELTRQLLAYAGRGRVEVGAVVLGVLVTDLVPLLEAAVGRRVSLAVTIDPDTPAVEADPTQLRQVVFNLVLNAADAMVEGGAIRLDVGRRRYDRGQLASAPQAHELPAGDYVVLAVADTGTGMSPETRQRIFDPFFTTKLTGRGLGLAAVLGIVRAHRGGILVDSAVGRGTTVTVLLSPSAAPAAQAVARDAAAPAVAVAGGLRGRVLVVDDEPMARDAAGEMLRRVGFEPIPAADGRAALAVLAEETASFVAALVDLTMPGMTGVETHREIRRRRATLPIVLMSGYGAEDARGALADGGPTVFLAKPFGAVDVAAALAVVIGHG
jgi:signal transduction histidine kinase/CHASE1-domain containing sensor protein/CheY-like chemotaxis protein